MSGTIGTKDAKILWSRAAGRCSKPDCRKELTFDKSEDSGSITFGQMCHIVGEKDNEDSPRGISKLPLQNRNEYSNLVLLCTNHHELIDKDVESWPVELLHKMKVDHELWVKESLTASELTPEIVVYSNLIDNLNNYLKLESFNWFMGSAIKNILHRDFIEALSFVEERQLAIVWPNSNLKLEKATKNMMSSFADYVNHFLRYGIPTDRDYDHYREDTSYKRKFNGLDYHFYSERNLLWAKKNFYLLSKYVFYLNQFAHSVREDFNPIFHMERGQFLVVDDFGMYHGGDPTMFLPEKKPINKKLKEINIEIEKFEKDNIKRVHQL